VTRGLLALLAVALAGAAAPARAADIFSPGELARAHASLEGLSNCTKCHPRGKVLSQGTCLDCHEELKGRIGQGRGYHGLMKGAERECWTCHHDHQGRDFAMVEWGPGGQRGFDHARTGFTLKGRHAGVDCQKCHDRKLIADPAVRTMLEKQPSRKTFLGSPSACNACHGDEHRGQLGTDCQKCHDEKAWKPVPGFDHAKTAYPLRGRHVRVACDKCHPKAEDVVEIVGLQPKNRTFLRMKPVAHDACLDCHKDPHQGRLGETCTKCHTEADWKTIVSGSTEDRSFHEKTKYKLEGAHATAKCISCHGGRPTEVPAQFKGLPFGQCTDCHVDAHAGQMRRRAADGGRCDRCHTVQGFETPRFGLEDHVQTRYPLEGAHRVVACASCHQQDPKVAERFPAAARDELRRWQRPVRASPVIYAVAGELARCETCHADAHSGQFDKRMGDKGCVVCHEVSSFARTRFDHAKDTRFALEGKHAKTTCASCHPVQKGPKGLPLVKYAGVETTCAGCHADPHGAQFARSPREATDCLRCHVVNEDWKKQLKFVHEPPFTDFKLTGKHLKVDCKGCHPEVKAVKLGGDQVLRRYKGVPRACESCHVDFHKGQFRGYEP
jgi:hypothetical protein